MARERQDITEAEMGVMHVLWTDGARSIRQIAEAVHGEGCGAAQYATVQKQLERLEAKGFVRRDRSLFVHLFTASVDREELIGRRLRDMAEKLCGGSLAPILSHLAKTKSLSDDERRALRELIDEPGDADAVAKSRRGKGSGGKG